MGRKLFISFLGTNNYIQTYYQFPDGEKSQYVRFIQEALIDKYCTDWTEEDKICIFCTSESMKCNWRNDGQKNRNEDIEHIGLEHILNQKNNLRPNVDMILIPEGFNSNEIWEIFEKVDEQVHDKDEIYFDVTHAFRSIPIFATTLLHYLNFMKNTKVAALNYGAFEKLGPAYEVRKMPKELRIAPVLDLMDFIQLQDWTFAAANLKMNGKMATFDSCLTDYLEANAEKKGGSIKNVKNNMLMFEQHISTCLGLKIKEAEEIKRINDNFKNIDKSNLPKPLKKIFKEIGQQLSLFTPGASSNIESAIHWCLKYGLIQQAYTLTQETIITHLCEKFKSYNPHNDGKDSDKEFRKFISSILGIDNREINNPYRWDYNLSSNLCLTEAFFALPWVEELREHYNKLKDVRNTINHAGFLNKTRRGKDIIDNAERFIANCLEFLHKDLESPTVVDKSESIFINLSNHKCNSWTEKQLCKAKEYGTIREMEFPSINPEATTEEINTLAKEKAEEIISIARTANVTVHVMGEMNYTFAIVNLLKKFGITCVASTTHRIVETLPDGVKQVKFDFIKFREY